MPEVMNNKILISKEIVKPSYLSSYGGKLWETPNIDALVKKGTIFMQHYTASPSTAMAITSMFSGMYPYQLDRKRYSEVKDFKTDRTLFYILNKKGFTTNVIWPFEWEEKAWKYSKVFPNETNVYDLKDLAQNIYPHILRGKKKVANELECIRALEKISSIIDECLHESKPVFIWLHLPHVLMGRTSYGSDLDLFDDLVGEIRKRFDDDSIYITADHGHMNCQKGIPGYGFHLYEGAIRIPLIAPRIMGKNKITFPTSNIQLMDVILNNRIERLKYIFSDTQYYLQVNRKLAIIKGNYKYIYNKRNRSEELYDLGYDPNENVNLLIESWYDRNRYTNYYLEEIYYYPYWSKAREVYFELKDEKNRIWREGNWALELLYKLNDIRTKGFSYISNLFVSKDTSRGRWNSNAQKLFYEK